MHDARAGVSEFIVTARRLEVLLRALAPHRRGRSAPGAAPLQPGQILVLTSARGGSLSTLSVNLAYELARRRGRKPWRSPISALRRSLAPFLGSDAPTICSRSPVASRRPCAGELRGRLAWLAAELPPFARTGQPAPGVSHPGRFPGAVLQALRANLPAHRDRPGALSHRVLLFGQADLIAMVFTPDLPRAATPARSWISCRRKASIAIACCSSPTARLGARWRRRARSRRSGPGGGGIPHAGANFSLGHSLHAPFSLRFPEEAAALALHEAAARVSEKMRIAA
jgi:hypothetical protein